MTTYDDYGPKLQISRDIHKVKYRDEGESFKDSGSRMADKLADNPEHFNQFREIVLDQRFLAAGRVQASVGSPRSTTPYNCFVAKTIPDSMDGIMTTLGQAAETMRLGGGIGYDFSTIRPKGANIVSLNSTSSGPVSFMRIYDAMCGTISSAGHRRGAQMGVLRVDHPDILEFIKAKNNHDNLTNFNISVAVTDKFMEAVKNKEQFELVFKGEVYDRVDAVSLWDDILRSTWDWAEPGVLFIDRMNKKNNLWYCETIAATNPCGEQPLPPHGACLLGSFNLVKYIIIEDGTFKFDYDMFRHDIPTVVRAMDNVVDVATYPLPEQEEEAKNKRRMGLGVTGLANAIESMGFAYGTPEFIMTMEHILSVLRDTAYETSIALAVEKGSFPLLDRELFLQSDFAMTLPDNIREGIKDHGIRNSHLLSIAPTGTISLSADNVSSGLEPVFSYSSERKVNMPEGSKTYKVSDYAYRTWGVAGRQTDDVPVRDHVKVLNAASAMVDSACSKTCNVGDSVTWPEFKEVYMQAYDGGASGCTTFRLSGKRFGMMTATSEVVEEEQVDLFGEGTACYIDPETGNKECG